MPRSEIDHEGAVRTRYSAGAKACQTALCCAVDYDPRLLEAIPKEVIERDYGCGDPTQYVARGETVLDLGSGSGKACFIASQIVGPTGRVIGVDMNDDMLALARGAAREVAARIGHANVEFKKARIQDLGLDCELLDAWLRESPVDSHQGLMQLETTMRELRETQPVVADASVDVVLSNCVLNLVRPQDKGALFHELFRVLVPGGRAVISDIVCDQDVPERLKLDPELWSGCIAGAFREGAFLEAFELVGFDGVTLLERGAEPWQVVEGIEFRTVTVSAHRPVTGEHLDQRRGAARSDAAARSRTREPGEMKTAARRGCC